jgi:hypothetical protein
MDIDREKLAERMEAYFDPDVSDEEMAADSGQGRHAWQGTWCDKAEQCRR